MRSQSFVNNAESQLLTGRLFPPFYGRIAGLRIAGTLIQDREAPMDTYIKGVVLLANTRPDDSEFLHLIGEAGAYAIGRNHPSGGGMPWEATVNVVAGELSELVGPTVMGRLVAVNFMDALPADESLIGLHVVDPGGNGTGLPTVNGLQLEALGSV